MYIFSSCSHCLCSCTKYSSKYWSGFTEWCCHIAVELEVFQKFGCNFLHGHLHHAFRLAHLLFHSLDNHIRSSSPHPCIQFALAAIVMLQRIEKVFDSVTLEQSILPSLEFIAIAKQMGNKIHCRKL